jgi:hypothetical protein
LEKKKDYGNIGVWKEKRKNGNYKGSIIRRKREKKLKLKRKKK